MNRRVDPVEHRGTSTPRAVTRRLLLAVAVPLIAVISAPTASAGADAQRRKCASPPSTRARVLDDGQAARILREMTLAYIREYQEPGRATIVNVVGQRRTRDNIFAAVALAEHGDYASAGRILTEVIASQNQTPQSSLYGYLPLLLGGTPGSGDEVWALFGGAFFLVLLDRHGERLPPDLLPRLRRATYAAAVATRSVSVSYLNTSQVLLKAFVLLRAGEVFQDARLSAEGRGVWRALYDFTRTSGIPEINSPNYSKIHIYALGFLADYLRDPRVRSQARQIRRLIWWSITRHFHAPTRQLAGPFSRTLTERMAYELSGIHFSLFRESRGRIALPPAQIVPSGFSYFDIGNAEARLHAALATLFRASWPRAWVDAALCTPRAFQFRERTISWPRPSHPTATGFAQFTTFLTRTTSLGSRNRDPLSMDYESRDVVAYANTADGDVGVFRLRINDPSLHITREVAVQNKRSVAVVAIADLYRPDAVSTMQLALEWRGTRRHPATVTTQSLGVGRTFVVRWMGTRTRVVFSRSPVALQARPRLSQSRPDAATVRVTWRGVLPRSRGPDGLNAAPAVTLAFAVHVDERGRSRGRLRPVTLLRQRRNWYRVAWNSPDGKLVSVFLNERKAVSVRQSVNGRPIRPAPLHPPTTRTSRASTASAIQ